MVIPYQERFIKPYLEALLIELKKSCELFQHHSIVSIYFGGGTPSLLPVEGIETILSILTPYLAKGAEITLEANPESVACDKVQNWKKMGINRLSLGVQSFQDQDLIQLTRTHDSKQIFQAIDKILAGGIANLSIDLLYDLFGQTPESLEKNLQQASSLPLTHISLYNLVIEPHTTFYKQKKMVLQPAEEPSLELHNLAIQKLGERFHRYEISAFAKEGYASVHNLGYWTARDCLGFGPSAWSYYNKKRTRKTQLFQRWIKEVKNGQEALDFEEKLEEPYASYEKLAIGLRVLEGIQLSPIQQNHPELSSLENEGFVEREINWVKLTAQGALFYDSVAQRIV